MAGRDFTHSQKEILRCLEEGGDVLRSRFDTKTALMYPKHGSERRVYVTTLDELVSRGLIEPETLSLKGSGGDTRYKRTTKEWMR